MVRASRLTATAVAIALVLVSAGCGSDDGDGGGESGNATLRIVGTADTRAAVTAVIDEYKRAHPNVTVETSFPATDQYTTATRTQLSGASGPDLFLVFPGGGNAMATAPLARANAMEDLSDQPWVGDIPEQFVPEVSDEGKTYFYPLGYDTIGAIYDKKVWQENGVEVPKTFGELMQTCKDFRAKGIQPIAVGMKTPFVPQFISYALVPALVYAENPDFNEQQAEGKATFADSGWTTAFERYVELEKAGCFNEGFNGTSYDDMLQQVATGKAAMTITVAPSMPAVADANPDGDFAMFPVPATDDSAEIWVPTGLSVGFAINARSKNKEAATEFLDFVNTPEQSARFASTLGILSLGDPPEAPAGLEQMVPPIEAGHFAPFPDHFWPNPEVQATHNAVLQQIFTGQSSIEEALAKMAETYEAGS